MSDEIDIQILMPTYNKSKLIKEALNSVLNQVTSYKYELIISDDNSKDGSWEICEEFAQKYPNIITLMRNPFNEGCLSNTLKCYKKTTSKYFTVLDPDDKWIDLNLVENALNFLNKNQDIFLYFENTLIENGNEKSNYLDAESGITSLDDQITLFGHTSCSFFRNIFSKSIITFLESKVGSIHEDLYEGDTFRNVFHMSKSNAYFKNNISSIYRFHKKGIWSKKSAYERDKSNFLAFTEYAKIFKNKKLSLLLKARIFGNSLINQIGLSDVTEHQKNQGIINYYIENAKEINLFTEESDKLSFLFFLPSRTLGGYETLFANAAEYLNKNIGYDVVFVDFSDGISHELIKEKSIEFFDYNEKSKIYKTSNHLIVFFPVTLSSELPDFIGKSVRYICYFAHPSSIDWLQFRSGINDKEIIKYLKKLQDINSLYFMCNSCYEAANKYFHPKKSYIPVFSKIQNFYKENINKKGNNKKNIKIMWLGRLDDDKYYSLSKLIMNLSKLTRKFNLELNIIGSGSCEEKIINDCKSHNIKYIFHGRIRRVLLDDILIKNSDIIFAMGTSVLEGAKLKIPSVMTQINEETKFGSNNYMWLYDAKEFELSVNKSQEKFFKNRIKTLEEILDEFLEDRNNMLGIKSYKHYNMNHSIEIGISKIIYSSLRAVPLSGYVNIKNYQLINKYKSDLNIDKFKFHKYLAKLFNFYKKVYLFLKKIIKLLLETFQ